MLLLNPGSISKPVLRYRCIGFIEINDDKIYVPANEIAVLSNLLKDLITNVQS